MQHPAAAALGNKFFGEGCHQRCSSGCQHDVHHWQWYSHSRPNEVVQCFQTVQNAFQGNHCTRWPLKPAKAFESIQRLSHAFKGCLSHPQELAVLCDKTCYCRTTGARRLSVFLEPTPLFLRVSVGANAQANDSHILWDSTGPNCIKPDCLSMVALATSAVQKYVVLTLSSHIVLMHKAVTAI